jgi:hypothetical protein
MTLSRSSIALLMIQLALVSSIAAKYLYQRHTCPKVWTRAVAYDPEMLMRGRYLSTQLHVDACGVKLPTPSSQNGSMNDLTLFDSSGRLAQSQFIPVVAEVRNNKFVVTRIASENEAGRQDLALHVGASCNDAILWKPVDVYLSEKAKSPFPLAAGQELWVEVTVPPIGPPRPLALAIKSSDGKWQPLNYR